MWFGLAKMALQAGAKVYSNKQKTKMAMSDAALMHAERMARGEESYQGKLLEARTNDYKDEFVLLVISAPIIVLAWGVFSDDRANDGEGGTFLSSFWLTANMVPNFVDYRRSEHFWHQGYTGISVMVDLRRNNVGSLYIRQNIQTP